MSPEQYSREQERMIKDSKEFFQLEQIKTEGNDPMKTGQSFGTAHDIASLYKGNGGVPGGYDERIPKGGWPGAGRPEEPGNYGTHNHPLGWDPYGNKENRKVYETSEAEKARSNVKLRGFKQTAIKHTLTEQKKEDSDGLLSESGILDE